MVWGPIKQLPHEVARGDGATLVAPVKIRLTCVRALDQSVAIFFAFPRIDLTVGQICDIHHIDRSLVN